MVDILIFQQQYMNQELRNKLIIIQYKLIIQHQQINDKVHKYKQVEMEIKVQKVIEMYEDYYLN